MRLHSTTSHESLGFTPAVMQIPTGEHWSYESWTPQTFPYGTTPLHVLWISRIGVLLFVLGLSKSLWCSSSETQIEMLEWPRETGIPKKTMSCLLEYYFSIMTPTMTLYSISVSYVQKISHTKSHYLAMWPLRIKRVQIVMVSILKKNKLFLQWIMYEVVTFLCW